MYPWYITLTTSKWVPWCEVCQGMWDSTLCWNLCILPQLPMSKQRNRNHSQDLEYRGQVAFYESSEVVLTVGKVKKDAEIKKQREYGSSFSFRSVLRQLVTLMQGPPRLCGEGCSGLVSRYWLVPARGCPEHVPALPGKVLVEHPTAHTTDV